jgi:hypothetical protein
MCVFPICLFVKPGVNNTVDNIAFMFKLYILYLCPQTVWFLSYITIDVIEPLT